ncbi:MAG: Propionate catabolism operon regulatory protein [Syntrophaceae bacterium PtaU1.Bin231]|nr:MAG: Propionate catabolism operon regulatory protein [Syntrophaceae bacterium PtaU1.Bin231]HOG16842.1 sigma 54-interacting transcriptional regulator [Syntrophales bacterium]
MIRITVMSAPMLSSVIQNLRYAPPPNVTIRVIDAILEEAVAIAKRIEAAGEADVFVSGGGNARIISGAVKKPLVEISVTGFDILHALKAARKFSDRVAVFAFREQIEHLSGVLDVLSMEVRTVMYDLDRFAQVERMMDELLDEGIRTVIGSSLVFQTAQRRGMNAVFIYSADSVKRALDQAVQIGLSSREEANKAREFKTILDFTYGGIIATDREGVVTVFNPTAEKITGISRDKAIGRSIGGLFPHTRFAGLVHLREPELNQIQSVGDRRILTNHIPILSDGALTGAVVTFQDVATIQEAEAKIRSKLFSKGFHVKTNLDDVHGRSPAVLRAKEEARRYASSDATVLILGESGTGKELFARGIHSAGKRASQPFVAVNCAAFQESLLESELFGYDEGAFTGARRGGKQGLLELAHGGTFFFDEIAEMPTSLQTRLLRVLEEREVMHIGGEKIIPVDIRVIAATNRDLWESVKAGRFREDLYYRLNVLILRVPSLRERPEDIPLLASLFLSEMLPDMPASEIRAVAKHPCLRRYDWPGNIRELKNFMERFAVLSPSFPDADSLLVSLFRPQEAAACSAAVDAARVLRESGGNRAEAARKLGISRSTLWRKLKALGVQSTTPRPAGRNK